MMKNDEIAAADAAFDAASEAWLKVRFEPPNETYAVRDALRAAYEHRKAVYARHTGRHPGDQFAAADDPEPARDIHYHVGGTANCPACMDRADYLADQESDRRMDQRDADMRRLSQSWDEDV